METNDADRPTSLCLNPSLEWNSEAHPWIDLADVVIEDNFDSKDPDFYFSVGHLPPSIRMTESLNQFDYASVLKTRMKLHPPRSLALPLPFPLFSVGLVGYHIKIHFDRKEPKGANVANDEGGFFNAYVKLVGSEGSTDFLRLTAKSTTTSMNSNTASFQLQNSKDSSMESHFAVYTDVDCGTLCILTLRLCGMRGWSVKHIYATSIQSGQTYCFPFSQYVHDCEVSAFEGTPTLLQLDLNATAVFFRNQCLLERRNIFTWSAEQQIFCPRFLSTPYDELPKWEKLGPFHQFDFQSNCKRAASNLLIDHFGDSYFDDFSELREVVLSVLPSVPHGWKNDVEFGRQFITGSNVLSLQRVNEQILSKFPLDDETIKSILPTMKLSLKQLLLRGRVFFVDFEDLEFIERKRGRHCSASMCYFVLNNSNELVPISIQLQQIPDSVHNPIFTPLSTKTDWTFAKMWVASASFNVTLIKHLYFETCLVMEPFIIAAFHHLPPVHPLYILLYPHFHNTLGTISLFRNTLFGKEGVLKDIIAFTETGVQNLLEKLYENWNFNVDNDVTNSITSRGVEAISDFWYCEDSFKIWKAIKEYVTEYICWQYPSDKVVRSDSELNAWIHSIVTIGHPKKAIFPDSSNVSTRGQLITLVTKLIWTCTGQHSAVRYSLFQNFCFVPNSPCFLAVPVPSLQVAACGLYQDESLPQLLPNQRVCAQQISILRILSNFGTQTSLGNWTNDLFLTEDLKALGQRFKNRLHSIALEIQSRNLTCPESAAYIFLHPLNICSSISATTFTNHSVAPTKKKL